MLRTMLTTKIMRATLNEANLTYEGSLTIPPEVLEASGILPYEQIMVANVNNGQRFWTYAIPGDRPAHFCLNGAAARLGMPGDVIIIFTFGQCETAEAASLEPRVVYMDEANRIARVTPG